MESGKYSVVIDIIADDFDLERIYSLYSNDRFRKDTMHVFGRQKVFRFIWGATILFAFLHKICELEDVVPPSGSYVMSPIKEFIDSIFGTQGADMLHTSIYFTYCFNKMIEFMDECINSARDEPALFYVDIERNFSFEKYLRFVFGEEVIMSWRSILRNIKKKVLVTLDGFDSAFDRFRRVTLAIEDQAERKRRVNFEIDWLRALLDFSIDAKSSTVSSFYKLLDFCIVVPMDRFTEAIRGQRDSYRGWHRWVTIQWSGIELADVLARRLEILSGTQYRSRSVIDRLDSVLKSKMFRMIPREIEFEFNDHKYRMHLFNYILRHTFWRPRDVLFYFACILAFSIPISRGGQKYDNIPSESIRMIVKNSTKKLLETEFIDELKSTVPNIEEIILCFKRKKWYMRLSDIYEATKGVSFKFAGDSIDSDDIVGKVKFLYDIGFVGLHLSKEQQISLGHWHNDVFYFNEGPSIFGNPTLDEIDLEAFDFVIHPVFVEYLRHDTREGPLPLVFDWDYLWKADGALRARMT